MRTYDRTTYLQAVAAWGDGQFGSEWADLRRLSWDRGYPYPPAGTVHDDREVENPSQRAIVYRALVDNPTELGRIVGRSKSWSQVVDQIIGLETRLREDADYVDRESDAEREERPTYGEAVTSLKAVLDRMASS
jgi:hypothetical protein